MSGHAKLSPSSAARWMSCPGSVTLSEGIEDKSSKNADEGTMMHYFAASCLVTGVDAVAYIGVACEETGLRLNEKQAKDVQFYVDHVRDIVKATGGELRVEQRLPIGWLTGEEDAHGTADAVIVTFDELIIVDAKFGYKLVDADDNPQLMIYAAAAYDELKIAYDFKRVRIAISQPRLMAKPEFTFSMAELYGFIEQVGFSAELTRNETSNREASLQLDITKTWGGLKLESGARAEERLIDTELSRLPFAGGGAIPLEAQRLGLESFATATDIFFTNGSSCPTMCMSCSRRSVAHPFGHSSFLEVVYGQKSQRPAGQGRRVLAGGLF
jgi:hypothetical protein